MQKKMFETRPVYRIEKSHVLLVQAGSYCGLLGKDDLFLGLLRGLQDIENGTVQHETADTVETVRMYAQHAIGSVERELGICGDANIAALALHRRNDRIAPVIYDLNRIEPMDHYPLTLAPRDVPDDVFSGPVVAALETRPEYVGLFFHLLPEGSLDASLPMPDGVYDLRSLLSFVFGHALAVRRFVLSPAQLADLTYGRMTAMAWQLCDVQQDPIPRRDEWRPEARGIRFLNPAPAPGLQPVSPVVVRETVTTTGPATPINSTPVARHSAIAANMARVDEELEAVCRTVANMHLAVTQMAADADADMQKKQPRSDGDGPWNNYGAGFGNPPPDPQGLDRPTQQQQYEASHPTFSGLASSGAFRTSPYRAEHRDGLGHRWDSASHLASASELERRHHAKVERMQRKRRGIVTSSRGRSSRPPALSVSSDDDSSSGTTVPLSSSSSGGSIGAVVVGRGAPLEEWEIHEQLLGDSDDDYLYIGVGGRPRARKNNNNTAVASSSRAPVEREPPAVFEDLDAHVLDDVDDEFGVLSLEDSEDVKGKGKAKMV